MRLLILYYTLDCNRRELLWQIQKLQLICFNTGVCFLCIKTNLEDCYIKHEELKYLSIDELVKRPFWNKTGFEEYAKKDAAFLMLCSDDPDLMSDIDSEKIKAVSKVSRESKPTYRKKQRTYEIPWCIACTSTLGLAKKIFKDSDNPVEDLWNAIFKICLIDEEDPIEAWNNKVIENAKMTDVLNKLKFKELHYTNSLGTNLKVELPLNHIWCGAGDKMPDGTHIFVNMPTEEVFTSPVFDKTEGIVYSSKPLVYAGSLIEDFFIEFKMRIPFPVISYTFTFFFPL